MSKLRRWWVSCVLAVAVAVAVVAGAGVRVAEAAVPTTVAVQGALVSGGGAVADGDYALTFRLFDAPNGGQQLWEDGPLVLTVKGGLFTATLGSKVPLPQSVLGSAATPWFAVQVGNDPELPRVAWRSVPYALRAAASETLDCSGCITAAHLDPQLLASLNQAGNFAAVATTGSYKDLVDTPKLSDVAYSGNYADLFGLPIQVKLGVSCGSGLVVRGIKADGGLDCVAGGIEANQLPVNGLAQISNGLLTNVFTDKFATTQATPIPDASLKGVTVSVDVADLGKAQNLTVSVDIGTSNISQIKVLLMAPDGASYLLHDKTGNAGGIKTSYPKPSPTLTGDLTAWIGKNPAGTWKLQVIDYDIGAGANDGQIASFAVQVETLSSKKFAANGAFQLPIPASVGPCNASNKGLSQLDPTLGLLVCDGVEWQVIRFDPMCGNGILNSGEQCDDGNSVALDGCFLCKTAYCGDGLVQAGEQCDNGVNNSDTKPDGCRTGCKNAYCGDKVVDSSENCDDGNVAAGDGCSPVCKSEISVNVTFTSCGVTGQNGPSQLQCTNSYGSTDLAGKVTVNGGIQSWVVPADGTYRIEVWGARGAANVNNQLGANGARVRGDFALKANQVLKILVGQMGSKSPNAVSSSGGGGTFVVLADNTPLIIAGGGGGRGNSGDQPGVGGTTDSCGTLDNRGLGKNGCNGQGGISGSTNNVNGGGGGAGLLGDGLPKQGNSGNPGKSFVSGGVGGWSRDNNSAGGFGGAGGNHEYSGGGGAGGGYSGGSGGQYDGTYGGGGGGGSYNSGANPSNASGVWDQDGKVTILKL